MSNHRIETRIIERQHPIIIHINKQRRKRSLTKYAADLKICFKTLRKIYMLTPISDKSAMKYADALNVPADLIKTFTQDQLYRRMYRSRANNIKYNNIKPREPIKSHMNYCKKLSDAMPYAFDTRDELAWSGSCLLGYIQ